MVYTPDSAWLWGRWQSGQGRTTTAHTVFWLVERSHSGKFPPGISLLLWSFQRMTSTVQMNPSQYFKWVSIFLKIHSHFSKGFPFWSYLDEPELQLCISQDRRMHSVHQRWDSPTLHSSPVSWHKANTHHHKMHPTTNSGSTHKELGLFWAHTHLYWNPFESSGDILVLAGWSLLG